MVTVSGGFEITIKVSDMLTFSPNFSLRYLSIAEFNCSQTCQPSTQGNLVLQCVWEMTQ